MKKLFLIFSIISCFGAPKYGGVLFETNTLLVLPQALHLSNEVMVASADVIATNSGRIDATALGLVANPSFDNTTASANSAILAVVGTQKPLAIYLPEGRFWLNSRLFITTNISFIGSGVGKTFICFTNMTTPTGAFFWINGTTNVLPNQAADINAGAQQVTFASAPDLNRGDFYAVINANDYSYSQWRTYYQQGEILKASDVVGSTVTNYFRTYASYTGITNSFYKINPVTVLIKDLSIEFPTGISAPGLRLSLAANSVVQNVNINGSRANQLWWDRCFRCLEDNVNLFDSQASIGENYGSTHQMQDSVINNFYGSSTRHSFASGSAAIQPNFVNRNVFVLNSTFGSGNQISGVPGLNLHGNSEYFHFINCYMPSGIECSGNHVYFYDSLVENGELAGRAVVASELTGSDWQFYNCNINAIQNFNSGLISWFNRTNNNQVGATLTFQGGRIDAKTFTSSTAGVFYGGGSFGQPITNEAYAIKIEGMTIRSDSVSNPLYLRFISPSSNSVDKVIIRNNILDGVGIRWNNNFKNMIVENDLIFNAPEYAIRIDPIDAPSNLNQIYSIKNILVDRTYNWGILADMTVTNGAKINLDILNSRLVSNGTQGAGWGSANITGGDLVNFFNNFYGDRNTPQIQTLGVAFFNQNILRAAFNYDVGIDLHPVSFSKTSVTNDIGFSPFEGKSWSYGTSAPTSTTHTNQVGDIRFNTSPISSSTSMLGWMTTVAGAPGTQVPFSFVNNLSFLNLDFTNLTVGIRGQASTLHNTPLNIELNTNAAVTLQIKNTDTGASAVADLQLVGSSGQGAINIYNLASGVAGRRDKMLMVPASNLAAAGIEALTFGQTIDFSAGYSMNTNSMQITSNAIIFGPYVTNINWNALALDGVGNGTPEGNFTAPVGSLFRRLDGGSGTTLYSKTTGSGNTGWSALASGSGDNWVASGSTNSTLSGNASVRNITVTNLVLTTNLQVNLFQKLNGLIDMGPDLGSAGTEIVGNDLGTAYSRSRIQATAPSSTTTNLDNITAFSGTDGTLIYIQAQTNQHFTVRHAVGNIRNYPPVDFILDDNSTALAIYDAQTLTWNVMQLGGQVTPPYTTLTDSGTVTWTVNNAYSVQNAKVTLGGNRTLDIVGARSGMTGTLIVIQDGMGGRSLTLPGSSKVISGGSGAITLTATGGAVDILTWTYDGTSYYWNYGKNYN